MIGGATNCEMFGSSAGAVEGLKPSCASDIIIGCVPGTPTAAGTAGRLPAGGDIGAEAMTGAGAGGGGVLSVAAGGGVLSVPAGGGAAAAAGCGGAADACAEDGGAPAGMLSVGADW